MADDNGKVALDRELRLNQLYLAIIARYKDYIEEKEHISVAELTTLVTPKDESVLAKANDIRGSFGAYSYVEHFYEASLKAYAFVRDEIEDVQMPLEFWLTPNETMKFGVGDTVDKNTLFCSLLIALGNPSTKVFVYVRGASRSIKTVFELNGLFYVTEFGSTTKRMASRDEFIGALTVDDDTIAYEFNDQSFVDVS